MLNAAFWDVAPWKPQILHNVYVDVQSIQNKQKQTP
jgi:hypothetical protein